MTWSAPPAPRAGSLVASSASPSARTRASTAASASTATIAPARFSRRAARAIEEPMRPKPTSARRSNKGSSRGGPRRSGIPARPAGEEVLQRRDGEPVRLLVADRHAQAVRQAVGADARAARARAASGTRRRPWRCSPASVGKWIRMKLPTLGVTASPSAAISRVSQGSQRSLWATAAAACASSAKRRDAGGDRRPVDVEGPADAVDGVDHMRRPGHPAEAQRGEAVDLREGAGHDDVLGRRRELEPGRVVVAAHVFGIGRVDDEKHVGGSPACRRRTSSSGR